MAVTTGIKKQKGGSKRQMVLLVTLVLVSGFGAYWFLLRNTSSGPAFEVSGEVPAAQSASAARSAEILRLIQELEALKIDTSLFSDARFQALVDRSVTIPPEQAGRRNPFLPIGVE